MLQHRRQAQTCNILQVTENSKPKNPPAPDKLKRTNTVYRVQVPKGGLCASQQYEHRYVHYNLVATPDHAPAEWGTSNTHEFQPPRNHYQRHSR